MDFPAMMARALPGKREEAYRAGITPRILRGTGDHTMERPYDKLRFRNPRGGCMSARSLLLTAVSILISTAAAADKVSIDPRPKKADTAEALPRSNIRVDSTLVLIPVTVTDPLNRFVTGLEQENFRVFEDKSRQAVAQFFKTANPEDEFFLVQFNDRPELVSKFTTSLEEIQNHLTFTQAKGRTALLDGVYMALHEMKKAKNPRKALLIISDVCFNDTPTTESEIK